MKKQFISITFTLIMLMILISGAHYSNEYLDNLSTSITWLYWAFAVTISTGGMVEMLQVYWVSTGASDESDNRNVERRLKELKEPKSKILNGLGLAFGYSLIITFAMLGFHILFVALAVSSFVKYVSKRSLKEYSERLEEDNGKL